jgi:hypothetical protein
VWFNRNSRTILNRLRSKVAASSGEHEMQPLPLQEAPVPEAPVPGEESLEEWEQVEPSHIVTFLPSWDEWVPEQDHPTYKQISTDMPDGPAREEINALRDCTEDHVRHEIISLLLDPPALLRRLKARYVLNQAMSHLLAEGAFDCTVMLAYPSQFYHEGKVSDYKPGGDQYVSARLTVKNADNTRSFGFVVDFLFDKKWSLKRDVVEGAVYENALAQTIEGDINTKIKDAQANYAGDDLTAAIEGFRGSLVPKTPEAASLLSGTKLVPVSGDELQQQFVDLANRDGGRRVKERTGDFFNARAASLVDVPASVEAEIDEPTGAAMASMFSR